MKIHLEWKMKMFACYKNKYVHVIKKWRIIQNIRMKIYIRYENKDVRWSRE